MYFQANPPSWLALGFRPFYLGASAFALISLLLWLLVLGGQFGPSAGARLSVLWHGHEMLYGFGVAVIAGFLLTAVRNWTGRATPTGGSLLALFLLWLVARLALLFLPGWPAALLDFLFLPVLAGTLLVPIIASRNWRNLKVLGVVLALAAVNALYHGGALGWVDGAWQRRSLLLGMDLVAVLIAIIGGRVIPVFSANAIEGLRPWRHVALDALAVGSLLAVVLLQGLDPGAALLPGVLALALVSNLVRWLLWKPHRTVRNGLLIMLPVAYLWIPLSLALRLWLELGAPIPASLPLHALTIGAMAGMMAAMMMRSALGHTGRALRAGLPEVAVFWLIQLAALLRVAGPLLLPQQARLWYAGSGLAWGAAFLWLLLAYWPVLTRPRVDGRPG